MFRSAQSDQKKEAMKANEADPEFVAIEHLLSSGALNPPLIDASAKPHVLIRRTASRLRVAAGKTKEAFSCPASLVVLTSQ